MATPALLEQVKKLVIEVQDFDPGSLAREQELGQALNFSAAVAPAARLVTLYRQLAVVALDDFPDAQLNQTRDQATQVLQYFVAIRDFKIQGANPVDTRNTLIAQLESAYNSSWVTLHPYIAYSAARATDFKRLEVEARDAIKSIDERSKKMIEALQSNETKSKELLEEIRKVAAEQGVSQQASYFKDQADGHEKEADRWRKNTVWVAVGLGIYAAATVVISMLPWFSAQTPAGSAQIITGKILLFAVIAYMLLLSAKNYLSNKHNAVVNRHRQNALLTFNALAQAASGPATRDIVLTHAAACIFSPQETGYAKGTTAAETSLPQAVFGLIGKDAKEG